MLQITLFGGFRLALDDTPLPPIPSQKARSLLAFLVCHANQDHTRALLVGHFYPELPEANARRRLSQALWQIRHTLHQQGLTQPLFITNGDTVRWQRDLPYKLDIVTFEEQLAAATQGDPPLHRRLDALTAAANLYGGDLLDGLYDEWILPLRERLRARYATLLDELIQHHKAQGAYAHSLHYAQQSLLLNPLQEAAHREIMRLCHLLGRTNEALQQYDTLRALLDEEFAAEPSADSRALYRQITGDATQPVPGPTSAVRTSTSRLVGRTHERQGLIGALDRTLGGTGTLAFVEGEPGIGKTRLLEVLADDATWRGLRVLWARGREVDQLTPYAMVRDLLQQELTPLRIAQLATMVDGLWLAEIAAFLPTLAPHFPQLPPRARLNEAEDQQRLFEAIRRVLQALGQLTPYLLLIDDLQWSDAESLALLAWLAPTLQQGPFCLCLAFRSEEARARAAVWALVRKLDLVANRQRLLLERLTTADIEQLLFNGLGSMAELTPLVERLDQESGGNPLFIHETIQALQDAGYLRQDSSGRWSTHPGEDAVEQPEPTPRLQQVVAGRLLHLDNESRTILYTVATLGIDFDLATLQAIGTLPNRQAMTAVDVLLQRNFLVARQGRYGISHDQIRQIVYGQIEDDRRRQLHQQIGDALATEQPTDAATLAYHFARGHWWDRAVHSYQRAGEEAKELAAYSASVEFYTEALAAFAESDCSASQHFTLLAARESALATLGRHQEQLADIAAMASLATTAQQKSLVYQRRFWAQLDTAALVEAEESARMALALAQESQDPATIAAALLALGTALDRRSHSAEAVPHLRAAVEAYQQLGDRQQEAQARVELANALTATADYHVALPELESAYQRYQQANDRAGEARALSRLGALQMERGESEAAATCFAQALAIAQEIGYRRAEATTLVNWANLHYFQNQISDFLACNERALALFKALDLAHGEAFVRVNIASISYGVLGEYALAQQMVEEALPHFQEIGDRGGQAQCLEQLGTIATTQGKYTLAQRCLDEALAAVQSAGDRWLEVFVHVAQANLAQAQGRTTEGLAALDRAEAICTHFALTDQLIALQGLRARLLMQQGDQAAALSLARLTIAQLNASVQQRHKVAYRCFEILAISGYHDEAAIALAYAHTELTRAMAGLTPEQRAKSLHHVPEHAAILNQWQATHAQTREVRLVRANVPTGRPVAEDEWVTVTLTITHPDDQRIANKKARRQQQLARLLDESSAQDAAPTVTDLATLLAAGKATIKRDLAELRAAGRVVKTRGSRER